MKNDLKKPQYIEDNFDLELFKREFHIKHSMPKNKYDDLITKILKASIFALSLVIVFQGYLLGSYYYDVWKTEKINNKANEIYQLTSQAKMEQIEAVAQTEEFETEEFETEEFDQVETESRLQIAESINQQTERPINKTILQLREFYQNEDIVGFIMIEGTKINNVVVKGQDNDFYLSRNLYKEENAAGSIFMDNTNSVEMTDYNTVLYGHNMRNGLMFHNLRYYAEADNFYEEHPIIHYITPYEETIWRIFSAYPTNTNFDYIRTIFTDENQFYALAEQMKEKSVIDTGIYIEPGDIIITLSTCTNTEDDMRYAIHAKLISRD